MSLVTLPRAQIPLTLNGNAISAEWYRWAHDITNRSGGVIAPSNDDLAISEYADAGIEETRAMLLTLADTVGQIPPFDVLSQAAAVFPEDDRPEVASLREEIAALRERVASLEQGQLL